MQLLYISLIFTETNAKTTIIQYTPLTLHYTPYSITLYYFLTNKTVPFIFLRNESRYHYLHLSLHFYNINLHLSLIFTNIHLHH